MRCEADEHAGLFVSDDGAGHELASMHVVDGHDGKRERAGLQCQLVEGGERVEGQYACVVLGVGDETA